MSKYKNFIVYWLILYMFIAIGGWFLSDNKEIFPFFRWSLYSKTPNTLVLPYIMVTKIGEDVLSVPKDLKSLFDVHHITPVTIDLNVNTFYKAVIHKKDLRANSFYNILPKGSAFILCTKTLDLSKESYLTEVKIDTIAYIEDEKILRFENRN